MGDTRHDGQAPSDNRHTPTHHQTPPEPIHVAPSSRRPSAQLLVLLRLLSATISDVPGPKQHRQLLRLVTFKLKLFDLFRHGHPVWPIKLGRAAATCRLHLQAAVSTTPYSGGAPPSQSP